jgi:hypothetical protein
MPTPKRSPARHDPAFLAVSAHPGKTAEGIFLPDASGSPVKSGRPTAGAGELITVAQAREEEEPNLGLCTEGSSPGWARSDGELGRKKSSGEVSEWCSSVRKKRPVRYPRAR